jgi:hypothetical protein
MALCFAYQFTVLLPKAGIGWQDHIGGLVGGLAGGWIFRDRAAARKAKARAAATAKVASSAKAVSPASAGTGTTSTVPTGAVSTGASTGAAKQQQRDTGIYSGPRADLHKQLDDMGL